MYMYVEQKGRKITCLGEPFIIIADKFSKYFLLSKLPRVGGGGGGGDSGKGEVGGKWPPPPPPPPSPKWNSGQSLPKFNYPTLNSEQLNVTAGSNGGIREGNFDRLS